MQMATRLQLLQVKVSLQTIVKIGILFLTVSQKPLHEGPERVDERFIRKLCLMFQLPDTEMMENFQKSCRLCRKNFLQLVLLGGIIMTVCAANPGQYLADRSFLADAVGESAERMKTGRKNFSFS